MFQRTSGYLLVNAIAPVLAIACVFAFAAGSFLLAWGCALCVALCMEARVQFGGRLRHTALFWMHLLSAVPFFLGLSALAFWSHPLWLEAGIVVLGLLAFCTGAVLWYRGVQVRVLHLSA